jgi:hypothetical protein
MGQLVRLINYAINQVADMAGSEVVDTAQTFNARTGTLVIPDDWAEFGGAYWAGTSGPSRRVSSRYLRVHPAERTVELWGAAKSQASRKAVTLFGYPRMQPLTAEDDATEVDAEWIVESVAQILTLGTGWQTSDVGAAAERRSGFWASRAQLYRRNIAAARRGLRISLP